MADKYTSTHVRRLDNRKGKPWQAILRYSVPNPDYMEPPTEGKDTRTAKQRRSVVFKQKTKVFDPSEVRTKTQANRACEAWRLEMEAAARRPDVPGANTPVADYVEQFIDNALTMGNIARRTASGYRTIAQRIREGFPNVTVGELTRPMVEKWETRLVENGLSRTTVRKYHRLLSEACEHAANNDAIAKNPCRGLKGPRAEATRPNSLTAEGYARLAATLDFMEPSQIVTAASIALHTGMRQGEVCALRWCDYDASGHVLRIEHSIGRDGSTYVTEPKTQKSRRAVPVPAQLAKTLERRRAAMTRELEGAGVMLSPAEFGELYIVGSVDGAYKDPQRVSVEWKAFSESLGLMGTQNKRVTFLDLRHSFATLAIAAGADVKAVSEILGHTNAAITLNVYADAAPESKRRASDMLASSISAFGKVEPLAELAEG